MEQQQVVEMGVDTAHLYRLNWSLEVPNSYGTEGFDDPLFQDKVFYGTDIPPSGKPTPIMTAFGYRAARQGTVGEIFGEMGNWIRWEASQVVVLCRHHFSFFSSIGGVIVFGLEGRIIMIRKLNATGLLLRAPYFNANQILKPPAGGGGMRILFPSH